MATFMVSLIPRASVSADRIQEVLDTDPSVVPPADPVRDVVQHGSLEFRDVGFRYPGAEHAVLTDISFSTAPGQTTAIVGSTGAGKTHAGEPRPATVRHHGGRRPRRRGRRQRARPGRAVEHDRLRAPAAVPLLGHGRQQPAVRQARRDRGGDVDRARGRAGRTTSSRDARRARRPDRAGRHQRVGWAAPAAVDRAGAHPPARHLRVRRLVLGARPRHRRPAASGARAVHERRRGRHRRAAGLDDRDRRRHPRARGRRSHRARAPTTS